MPSNPASVKQVVAAALRPGFEAALRENAMLAGIASEQEAAKVLAALADWLESDEAERTALRLRLQDVIDLGPYVCNDILSTLAAELRGQTE